jgi:hypothetical protein
VSQFAAILETRVPDSSLAQSKAAGP